MTSGGQSRRRLVRRLAVLAGLAFLLALPRIWRFTLAALLLLDTLGATQAPLLPRIAPEPRRILTSAPGTTGPAPADLYLPASRSPNRAFLLIHGVNETGKDDRRIVTLASNLARVRSAVLVPDFPNLRRLRVGPADAEAVALAYQNLLARYPELCRAEGAKACGLMSFSYGVGPALIAAADPRVRDRMGFVVAFGGYADLTEVIRFVTTGQSSDPRVEAVPYPWAKWMFITANAALVRDRTDRALLEQIARRKMDDPDAGVTALVEKMGAEGLALWSVVTNRDPRATEALLGSASRDVQDAVEALSPLPRIPDIRARLLLAHGIGDRSIPFTESERIAAAAPDRSSLTLTRLFIHVDPAAPGRQGLPGLARALPEAWRMIWFVDEILAQSA